MNVSANADQDMQINKNYRIVFSVMFIWKIRRSIHIREKYTICFPTLNNPVISEIKNTKDPLNKTLKPNS